MRINKEIEKELRLRNGYRIKRNLVDASRSDIEFLPKNRKNGRVQPRKTFEVSRLEMI